METFRTFIPLILAMLLASSSAVAATVDIQVTNISSVTFPGSNIQGVVTVHNNGPDAVPMANVFIQAWRSCDNALSANDVPVGGRILAGSGTLNSGQDVTITVVGANVSGSTYWYLAQAKFVTGATEVDSNQGNNVLPFQFAGGTCPTPTPTPTPTVTPTPTPVPQTLMVTSPNGGETFTVNGAMNISWSSSGPVSSAVKVELSTNNGGAWTTLSASTTNDGNESFVVPSSPSTTCLVRVTDTDGSPSDVSNGVFTIKEIVTPTPTPTPTPIPNQIDLSIIGFTGQVVTSQGVSADVLVATTATIPAANVNVMLYLSSDGIWDQNDTPAGGSIPPFGALTPGTPQLVHIDGTLVTGSKCHLLAKVILFGTTAFTETNLLNNVTTGLNGTPAPYQYGCFTASTDVGIRAARTISYQNNILSGQAEVFVPTGFAGIPKRHVVLRATIYDPFNNIERSVGDYPLAFPDSSAMINSGQTVIASFNYYYETGAYDDPRFFCQLRLRVETTGGYQNTIASNNYAQDEYQNGCPQSKIVEAEDLMTQNTITANDLPVYTGPYYVVTEDVSSALWFSFDVHKTTDVCQSGPCLVPGYYHIWLRFLNDSGFEATRTIFIDWDGDHKIDEAKTIILPTTWPGPRHWQYIDLAASTIYNDITSATISRYFEAHSYTFDVWKLDADVGTVYIDHFRPTRIEPATAGTNFSWTVYE